MPRSGGAVSSVAAPIAPLPLLVLLLLIFADVVPLASSKCGYQSCNPTKPGLLNVHLVPHTHDDVGWLKTVDQYYYGSAKDITPVGVQYILDSVVPQLLADPEKRFIYVEVAFFWRWWREQSAGMRENVKKLVNSGRLELVNGGWCMNDEAASHYNAIIDQMTLGLRRLADTFGECGRPRVAWQIDPFGHSKEQANLFALMGFDGLFFGRLDHADRDKRLKRRTMEMVWEAREDNSSWLFTGALFNGYGPPAGFCFDEYCADDPVMDDREMLDYNVDDVVRKAVEAARKQAKGYATDHIMWTMGSDFNYNNANSWYKNMDKLIRYVNGANAGAGGIHMLYSTPSCYLKAVHESNRTWTSKQDDFFPYASDPHAYWTGYFTSRPSLKRMVRQGNNHLQICKQFSASLNLQSDKVTVMSEAMGVLQHHDAVTGTAKQAVTEDYALRLDKGFKECDLVVSEGYSALAGGIRPDFCRMMNVSQCELTETSDTFVVNVYNPLGRRVFKYLRLPVTPGTYSVQAANGGSVKMQLVPIPKPVLAIPGRKSKATHNLVFKANDLPPLGHRVYFVRKVSQQLPAHARGKALDGKGSGAAQMGFGRTMLALDRNGNIVKVAGGVAGREPAMVKFRQRFGWYEGHKGNNSAFNDRASGAYIFRPNHQEPHFFLEAPPPSASKMFKGDIVHEVHQVVNDWISQVVRIYRDSSDVEFEWLIGPLPIDDGVGKEIITVYDTDLQSSGRFHTDANGRQMIERIRNYRPTWNLNVTEPVSGNYYPINSRVYLTDSSGNGNQMTILTDRSQGGSSMKDGQVEVMLHRRLLCDDAFGVGEALNETAFGDRGLVVIGHHWVHVGKAESSARQHRLRAEEIFMDSQVTFVKDINTVQEFESYASKIDGKSLAVVEPFPDNVHLLTLEPWGERGDRILVRLEHQFDEGEDDVLSRPVTIRLDKHFFLDVAKVEEVTLGANLDIDELSRLRWKVEGGVGDSGLMEENSSPSPGRNGVKQNYWGTPIRLEPMDIRTFIMHLFTHH